MNVGELKDLLNKYPDQLEVIYACYSDYSFLEGGDIKVVKAVPQPWGVMRSHRTMSDENKAKEREFLLFPGN